MADSTGGAGKAVEEEEGAEIMNKEDDVEQERLLDEEEKKQRLPEEEDKKHKWVSIESPYISWLPWITMRNYQYALLCYKNEAREHGEKEGRCPLPPTSPLRSSSSLESTPLWATASVNCCSTASLPPR